MLANLFKVSQICWAVTTPKEEEPQVFKDIEGASDYLMSIGVDDDHIDEALAELAVRGTTRAQFDERGRFSGSDHGRLSGPVGSA